MIAKIRHVATHTEHYDKECKFYQTIFGMKQITTGLVDENGKPTPNAAISATASSAWRFWPSAPEVRPGARSLRLRSRRRREAVDRLEPALPGPLHTRALTYVPFAGIRAQDPTGTFSSIYRKKARPTSAKAICGRLGTAALAQSHRAARPQAGGSRRVLHQSLGAQRRGGRRRRGIDHAHRR